MNKTLYLRDEDGPIWDKARELSNGQISPVIMANLKRYIGEQEAEKRGFEKLVVRFADAEEHGIPKVKSFYGRWILPPKEPYTYDLKNGDSANYAVAITRKGSVVIYDWKEDLNDGWNYDEHFNVYVSFSSAASDDRVNVAVCQAICKMGVPVEELDI